MQWKKVCDCSWFNFWSDGKRLQIAKCTYIKPKQKQDDFQHSRECTLSVMFLVLYLYKICSVWQRNCHNALSHFSVYVWNKSIFVAGSESGGRQCSCNRWSFRCNNSASSITGGLLGDRAWSFCVYNYYTKLIRVYKIVHNIYFWRIIITIQYLVWLFWWDPNHLNCPKQTRNHMWSRVINDWSKAIIRLALEYIVHFFNEWYLESCHTESTLKTLTTTPSHC